jgi:multiple sugar transport system permease protein
MATIPAINPILTTTAPSRSVGRWFRRRGGRTLAIIAGCLFFGIWTLFPFMWIIQTSLKPDRDIYRAISLWPQVLTFEHYQRVVQGTPFLTYFRNSFMVAILTTVIAMAIAVLAAYALTRLTFAGRAFVARATVVTYLIPAALLFIPLTQVALQFNLTNRALGLVVIYLIFSVPFSTWLTISYFNTVPSDLEDAALVDGANRLQALRSVFIPLALPALAVVALFTFTQSWNEFLFALLLVTSDSQKTLPVGLSEFVIGDVFAWGPLMAGSLIASLPPVLIYVVAQRWIVSGLGGGAIKG